MRRFSQRTHLVTLNEINITPLLDLAFVLLIIFIITTPLLDQGLQLTLPDGGTTDASVTRQDIQTVEIDRAGVYWLNRRQMDINTLEKWLIYYYKKNPNTVIYIRADENGLNKDVYAVIDRCQRNNITRFSLRTKSSTNR